MEQSLWAFVLYGMVKVWTLKSKWDSFDICIWSFEPSPFESQPKRHSFDKDTLVDDLWAMVRDEGKVVDPNGSEHDKEKH